MSGSSVHGISQARILEWVAISFSRGSSQPRDQTCVCLLHWQAGSLPLSHQGSPYVNYISVKKKYIYIEIEISKRASLVNKQK